MIRRPVSTLIAYGAFGLLAVAAPDARGDDTVVGSPHDLSALSPSSVRSLREDQVCVFCHVPHTENPQAPAWARANPQIRYRIYQSTTTDARIDQPSGVSKQCLSCHDGLMALGMSGNLTHPHGGRAPDTSVMTRRFMPPGPTNLTNDLRDDHPIGFRYDRALSRRDPQIRPPEQVSRTLPLGKHNEVHCTACHDPHNNRLGDFLQITDQRSALCLTCHDMFGWPTSMHAQAANPTIGRKVDPTERLKYGSVADNGCAVCHKIHSAPHAERLLRQDREEDNCLNCHDGGIAKTNILAQIKRSSAHRGDMRTGVHDPTERTLTMRPHVECVDCHNPHAIEPGSRLRLPTSLPPLAVGAIKGAAGVDQFGRQVERATFAYEICLRCHADNPLKVRSRIVRQVPENNVRKEFQTTSSSFHPVFASRNNTDVVSLLAPYRVGSVLTCTDCHNADDSTRVGGAGPNGPHGSRFKPLLMLNYDTRDFTTESAQAYALCYKCHDRNSILSDESFSAHRLHITVARTPCSACHDPHGVRFTGGLDGSHTNLINFDTRIVRPVITGGGLQQIRYNDTGRHSGNCTLACHGVNHVLTPYGSGGGGALKAIVGSAR